MRFCCKGLCKDFEVCKENGFCVRCEIRMDVGIRLFLVVMVCNVWLNGVGVWELVDGCWWRFWVDGDCWWVCSVFFVGFVSIRFFFKCCMLVGLFFWGLVLFCVLWSVICLGFIMGWSVRVGLCWVLNCECWELMIIYEWCVVIIRSLWVSFVFSGLDWFWGCFYVWLLIIWWDLWSWRMERLSCVLCCFWVGCVSGVVIFGRWVSLWLGCVVFGVEIWGVVFFEIEGVWCYVY